MITDTERKEIARRLREAASYYESMGRDVDFYPVERAIGLKSAGETAYTSESVRSLADLIEPSSNPSVEYKAWYDGLISWAISRDEAKTVRELIEEIVWTALTVDLGPNGNTDPSTGADEGVVYTDGLFSEWEREVLRLSGGIDRDALLKLADELDTKVEQLSGWQQYDMLACEVRAIAYRIRKALGVSDNV